MAKDVLEMGSYDLVVAAIASIATSFSVYQRFLRGTQEEISSIFRICF